MRSVVAYFVLRCILLLHLLAYIWWSYLLEAISLVLTSSSANGVLGVSLSCHFGLLEYCDFQNSMVVSLSAVATTPLLWACASQSIFQLSTLLLTAFALSLCIESFGLSMRIQSGGVQCEKLQHTIILIPAGVFLVSFNRSCRSLGVNNRIFGIAV